MVRTQRLSAEERRVQILEAALDEFADKGFNGARTKKIARRAGISETLIYQHFATKEALYHAAHDHLYSLHPMHDDMRDPMASNDDAALLEAVALHMLHHSREDPRIIRLHLYDALSPDAGRSNAEYGKHNSEHALAAYFQRRMNEGAFAPGDPTFAARLYHYMVFMAIADGHLGLFGAPMNKDDGELARTLSRAFLEGHLAR
ncbi:MAG: TetR/AcrR family transcriptional regulator [Oceanidesulfovibrio sp.]